LPGPVDDLVSDGHGAALSKVDGSVTWRDLDSGEERVLLPPDGAYRSVIAVARPYIAWVDFDSFSVTILNLETEAQQNAGWTGGGFTLSPRFALWAEYGDTRSSPSSERLVLRNLDTREEGVIAEDVIFLEHAKVFDAR